MIGDCIRHKMDKLFRFFDKPMYVSGQSRTADLEKIICLLEKIKEIQKKLTMYKEFWDHAGEAFLLVHHENEMILDANPVACALYGYRREDLLKKKITDLSESPQCTRAGMDERATHIPLRWHLRRGGVRFPIKASVSYFNDQGYTVCAVIIQEVPLPKEMMDEVH